jgi:hypothetical protein
LVSGCSKLSRYQYLWGLKYSCQRQTISNADNFSFDYGNTSFTSVPVILCNIQDDNCGTGTNAYHVRWGAALSTSNVVLYTETMASSTLALPASPSTSVGVLAIEQGTGSNPFIKTVISGDIVTHTTSYTLSLGATYPEVTVIGNCTIDGGDSAAVAITGQTSSSATVTIQEAAVRDGGHTTEKASLVAFGKPCLIWNYASGGTITDVMIGSNKYRIHAFTTVGTSTFDVNTSTLSSIDVLLVAGGGGGGGSAGGGASGAGGGAGGLILDLNRTVTTGAYTIVVGDGGTGVGSNSDTRGGNGGITTGFTLTAVGGGGGGSRASGDPQGLGGGSGGGEGSQGVDSSYGSGTSGQGFRGGLNGYSGNTSNSNASGGGGGAGGVGGDGLDNNYSGDGGVGLDMSTYFTTAFGENGYFAGGGGGGRPATVSNGHGSGGTGGGGDGGDAAGQAGTENTGGGGGGAGSNLSSGAGGSGIVLIRYQI